MKLAPKTRRWLILTSVTLSSLLAVTACFKKGSGKGSRATRPTFGDTGSIFDDGDKNQNPPGPPGTMDPVAIELLADCFDIPTTEVQPIVGWTDAASARAAAQELCAKIAATGYKSGILPNSEPVEID